MIASVEGTEGACEGYRVHSGAGIKLGQSAPLHRGLAEGRMGLFPSPPDRVATAYVCTDEPRAVGELLVLLAPAGELHLAQQVVQLGMQIRSGGLVHVAVQHVACC